MKKFYFLLFAFTIVRTTNGQTLSPTVINSSGGVIQNSSHSLEWSLGELAVTALTSPANLLTQGFLQPSITIVGTEDFFDESRFSAFPNPVSYWLNLQTDIPEIKTVQVHDVSGKLVLQSAFQPLLDLHQLETGILVISLLDQHNKFLHAFKINKI